MAEARAHRTSVTGWQRLVFRRLAFGRSAARSSVSIEAGASRTVWRTRSAVTPPLADTSSGTGRWPVRDLPPADRSGRQGKGTRAPGETPEAVTTTLPSPRIPSTSPVGSQRLPGRRPSAAPVSVIGLGCLARRHERCSDRTRTKGVPDDYGAHGHDRKSREEFTGFDHPLPRPSPFSSLGAVMSEKNPLKAVADKAADALAAHSGPEEGIPGSPRRSHLRSRSRPIRGALCRPSTIRAVRRP